jgi:hypothetical protein
MTDSPTRPAPLAVGDTTNDPEAIAALDAFFTYWRRNDEDGGKDVRTPAMRAGLDAAAAWRRAQPASGLLQREVDAHRKRIDESNFFEGMWRSAEKETIELEAKLAARDAEVAKLRDVVNALLGRIHAVAVQYEIGHTYPEEERALAALSGHVSPLT